MMRMNVLEVAPDPDATCDRCGHTRRVHIPYCDVSSFRFLGPCSCPGFRPEWSGPGVDHEL